MGQALGPKVIFFHIKSIVRIALSDDDDVYIHFGGCKNLFGVNYLYSIHFSNQQKPTKESVEGGQEIKCEHLSNHYLNKLSQIII